ncbi:hypothetical protein [Lewinella sp. JB7]|uniref:hypothetical protein n=1 Tax=Lewinella sp. JB7 TaxID=2962887 RepID=UPI0020C9DAE9|nr:hypothetical protein [Lewinella sp. JB7]MCP9235016.1 hypothetical protein [Lewinella sp. JB7]
MASFKKELKAIMSRFDAAQEAFADGVTKQEKTKKKLKSAKAKIKGLQQKVASLEQELKVAKKKASKVPETAAGEQPQPKRKDTKSKETKSTGARRGRTKKSAPTATSDNVSGEDMAQAVSDAPDSVSEAAAEKSAPKSRRGRPRKTQGAAKSARKTASRSKTTSNGTGSRRGRPSTKGPASELTKISGVGATMAARFEEAGVKTIEEFAQLNDDQMKDVLQKCGPRYRNADSDKMEMYRSNAREAMAS